MKINSSKINFTANQAVDAVLKKVNNKGVLDPFHINKKKFNITGTVKLIYFPYWIGFTISDIHVRFLGRKTIPFIVAVEGYKGESGISLGFPDTAFVEVDDSKIIQPVIDECEAKNKIIYYATQQIMKRNRHLPKVTLSKIDLVWKPTYVVPIKSNEIDRVIYKFVDAESNYLIYRYDLEINKLKDIVRELVI